MVGTEVLANWQAEDTLSGVDIVSGTVDSGTPLDTRSLGLKSFTVTATDLAGNQAKKPIPTPSSLLSLSLYWWNPSPKLKQAPPRTIF